MKRHLEIPLLCVLLSGVRGRLAVAAFKENFSDIVFAITDLSPENIAPFPNVFSCESG